MFAAIDGGSQLWEASGLWRGSAPSRFYGFRAATRVAVWALSLGLAALLLPVGLLGLAALFYPFGMLLQLFGLQAGAALASGYGRVVAFAFEEQLLPTLVPRAVTVAVMVMCAALIVGSVASRWGGRRRRERDGAWWRFVAAPLDSSRVVRSFTEALGRLIRVGARGGRGRNVELSRHYAELIADNVGQPGFRELLVTVHDLDARSDLVFAVLAEPYRKGFFAPEATSEPVPESSGRFDLGGVSRDQVVDALSAALSLPVVTDAHLMTFPTEGYWRGETHRLCDRPDAIGQLLDTVAAAGARQVILVAAESVPGGPHQLTAARRQGRARFGDYLGAMETLAAQEAVALRRGLFDAVFPVRPTHNPIGPFDFTGCYDEQSDRRQSLSELVDRGYEDAYRQFIDPVVGASGEGIEGAGTRQGLQ